MSLAWWEAGEMELTPWEKAQATFNRLAERQAPERAAKVRAVAVSFELARAHQRAPELGRSR